MRHALIPDGWEYYTTETTWDAAWALAVQHKQDYESLRHDKRMRVKVVPASGVHWIIRKIEDRPRSTV